jgi:hypothetical protein
VVLKHINDTRAFALERRSEELAQVKADLLGDVHTADFIFIVFGALLALFI